MVSKNAQAILSRFEQILLSSVSVMCLEPRHEHGSLLVRNTAHVRTIRKTATWELVTNSDCIIIDQSKPSKQYPRDSTC